MANPSSSFENTKLVAPSTSDKVDQKPNFLPVSSAPPSNMDHTDNSALGTPRSTTSAVSTPPSPMLHAIADDSKSWAGVVGRPVTPSSTKSPISQQFADTDSSTGEASELSISQIHVPSDSEDRLTPVNVGRRASEHGSSTGESVPAEQPQSAAPANGKRRLYRANNELNRKRVAEILGLPNNKSWQVHDYYNDLVIVDRNEMHSKCDPELRGIVIHLASGTVVAPKYKTAPIIVTQKMVFRDNARVFQDIWGEKHEIKSDEITVLRAGVQGFLLHIFKWAGEIFVASNTNLHALDAWYNKNEPFRKVFEATGIKPEDFFDAKCTHSAFVHSVWLLDDSFSRASHVRHKPALGYIGTRKSELKDMKGDAILETEATDMSKLPFYKYTDFMKDGQPDFAAAGTWLDTGLGPRVNTQVPAEWRQGESLYMELKDGRHFCIDSISFNFRNEVFCTPDVYTNLYDYIFNAREQLTLPYGIKHIAPTSLRNYVDKFGLYHWPGVPGIGLPPVAWLGDKEFKVHGGERIYKQFAALLMIAPSAKKHALIDQFVEYIDGRYMLIKWLNRGISEDEEEWLNSFTGARNKETVAALRKLVEVPKADRFNAIHKLGYIQARLYKMAYHGLQAPKKPE